MYLQNNLCHNVKNTTFDSWPLISDFTVSLQEEDLHAELRGR